MFRSGFLLIILFASFTTISAKKCKISRSARKAIVQNSFMLVPINPYAHVIEEARARKVYRDKCQGHLSPSEKLNCQVLKTCQGDACIAEYESHGTAFLSRDGRRLLTAWHVVHPSHNAPLMFLYKAIEDRTHEDQIKAFHSMSPSFLLFDHEGRKVYDTRNSPASYRRFGNPLSTIYSHLGHRKGHAYGFFENVADDFVQIELSQNLGEGLPTSRFRLGPNECIYSAGFAFNRFNSQFRIQSGRGSTVFALKRKLPIESFHLNPLSMPKEDFVSQPMEKIMADMGYSDEDIQYSRSRHTDEEIWQAIHTLLHIRSRHQRDLQMKDHQYTYFFSNPIMSGQSGGPLLNEAGEVVGILTNGFLTNLKNVEKPLGSVGGAAVRWPIRK